MLLLGGRGYKIGGSVSGEKTDQDLVPDEIIVEKRFSSPIL